jgi:hypothetical protein
MMMAENAPTQLLANWIGRHAAPTAIGWLEQKRLELAKDASGRVLLLAISMAPRRMGRQDLVLSEDDRAAAERARVGWRPGGWTVDEAARILLLLSASHGPEPVAERLRSLAVTSDVGELIAIYRGLPLYPAQPTLTALAAEGLRTSMRTVFEAVAHNNPFPAEQFSEGAWNHMVLKALFIESSLQPIQGLDRRWNPALTRTLCDYAHERWAASRPVAAELWRGVGRFADDAAIGDLARVLQTGSPTEREAAALALSESDHASAAKLLAGERDLAAGVRAGHITWASLQGVPAPSIE